MTIPISSITEGTRGRNAKKYGDLKTLAASIKNVGMIQPIVLSRRSFLLQDPRDTIVDNKGIVGEKYDLVAGGRRLRAIQSLGITELHHAVTLQPGIASFVFQDEVPADVQKEAELDENLHRLDQDWLDQVLMIADIHEAKRKVHGTNKWGGKHTSQLLGKGFAESKVSHALRIAKLLRAGDKELPKCGTMMEAVQLLIKRSEEAALKAMQKHAATAMPMVPAPRPSGTSSFLDELNIHLGPQKKGGDAPLLTPTPRVPASKAAPKVQPSGAAQPAVRVPLSQLFWHGDFQEVPLQQKFIGQIDHIVTDIPYGINMDNLDEKQVADVAAEHTVEGNLELMPKFLKFAFSVLRPGGFCVFFYDLDHHEKLQSWATAAGFKIQRWPFIACKTSSAANQAAQYNLTKNFEACMWLRRDEKSVLRHDPKHALNNTSWKAYNFAAERDMYNNPFAKPSELWKDIYDMISFPGQSVLDPFCGEMSACRAAANCGRVPYGIEINEKHYMRGLEHMKAIYRTIHGGNVEFV